MIWLAIALGALIGAPLRYLVDRALSRSRVSAFPWGTMAANTLACAGLGFLTGAVTVVAVPVFVAALVGPGLCATLSTYSTFSAETVRLVQDGRPWPGLLNAALSVAVGLGAALLGTVGAAHLLG